jgi:hypothetical protein
MKGKFRVELRHEKAASEAALKRIIAPSLHRLP